LGTLTDKLDLGNVGAERMRAAVRAAMGQHSNKLREGAEHTLKDQADASARYFQALLEVGYLVASADGLAEDERHALSELLEDATGAAVDRAAFELHFSDLDAATAMLGRHERLRRTAEEFEDRAAQEEALAFGILVAVADGELADPEQDALNELATHFGFTQQDTRGVLERVIGHMKHALGSAQ
jgi:tellurite resistance protein